MVYTPLNWKNREVERPRTFQLQNNSDGTVTLIPKEGVIVEPGTPIIADNMNRIEQGIVDVSNAVGNGVADYVRQPAFAGTAGTATAYTVTLSPAPESIPDGFGITIIPHVTSGTNPTLNVNGLGAFPLKKQNGLNYPTGKLVVGKPYTFRKVGTDFLADSTGGNGDALVSDVRAGKKFTNDDNDDLTGSLVVRAAEVTTITPGPSTQSLLPGIYDNTIIINGVSVPAAKVLNDTEIAGTKGTMVKRGSTEGAVSTTWDGNNMLVRIPLGGYTQVTSAGYPEIMLSPAQARADSNITAANIRLGTWVYGVQGTLQPVAFATIDNRVAYNGGTVVLFTLPSGVKYAMLSGGLFSFNGKGYSSSYALRVYLQDGIGNQLEIYNINLSGAQTSTQVAGGIIVDTQSNTIKFPNRSPYENGFGTYDINPETGVFTKPFNIASGFSIFAVASSQVGGDTGTAAQCRGALLWG